MLIVKGVRYIVKEIPFYEAEEVKAILPGVLRGRGQRTGFDNPTAPSGYRYDGDALSRSLPKHLATSFTLYSGPINNRHQYYTKFKGFTPNGKLRLRLIK